MLPAIHLGFPATAVFTSSVQHLFPVPLLYSSDGAPIPASIITGTLLCSIIISRKSPIVLALYCFLIENPMALLAAVPWPSSSRLQSTGQHGCKAKQ
jgi:hypothetical protein